VRLSHVRGKFPLRAALPWLLTPDTFAGNGIKTSLFDPKPPPSIKRHKTKVSARQMGRQEREHTPVRPDSLPAVGGR